MSISIKELQNRAFINTQSSQEHFGNVHGKLIKEFSRDAYKNDAIAKKATRILNQIKNLEGANANEYYMLQQELTKFFNFDESRQANPYKRLFRRHAGKNAQKTGEYFEKEMAGLRQLLINMALKRLEKNIITTQGYSYNNGNKVYVNLDFETGKIQASPKSNKGIDVIHFLEGDILKQEDLETVMNYAKKHFGKPAIENLIVTQMKQTKSDMHGGIGTAGFDIEWDLGNDAEWLGWFLSHYNFSLKNYKDITDVHLGDTNPYRAYFSVLSKLGYDGELIHNSFLRAFCCYINSTGMTKKNHKPHQKYIKVHMGHIQSTYELIGMGLQTTQGWQDHADFIIINEHSGNNIQVISTSKLMLDTISKDRGAISVKGNPFSGSSVSMSALG